MAPTHTHRPSAGISPGGDLHARCGDSVVAHSYGPSAANWVALTVPQTTGCTTFGNHGIMPFESKNSIGLRPTSDKKSDISMPAAAPTREKPLHHSTKDDGDLRLEDNAEPLPQARPTPIAGAHPWPAQAQAQESATATPMAVWHKLKIPPHGHDPRRHRQLKSPLRGRRRRQWHQPKSPSRSHQWLKPKSPLYGRRRRK